MYELTCPWCRHAIRTPFVRLGASAICRACGQRFAVKSDFYKRVPASSPPPSAEAGELLPPPRPGSGMFPAASAPGPPETRPPAVGVASAAEPAPPAPAAAEPAIDLKTPAPAHRRHRPETPLDEPADEGDAPTAWPSYLANPATRRLVLAGGLLALLLVGGIIAVSVWLNALGGGAPPLPPLPAPVPWDATLPLARPEPLIASDWTDLPDPRSFRVPTHDSPVRLEDIELTHQGGTRLVRGTVTSPGMDIIESADLVIYLLDEDGQAFAQRQVPLALVCSRLPQELLMHIGEAYEQRAATIEWEATAGASMPGAHFFESPLVVPVVSQQPAVKLTAFNPLDRPVTRSVFLIKGFDRRDRPLGAWRVIWTQPVAARQRVEFQALLAPPGGGEVYRWEAWGACAPP